MTKIVNRKEMAEILSVTPQTLNNWLREGLPFVEDNGTNAGKMYSTSAVIGWMVERKAGGTGAGAVVQRDEDAALTKERRINLEIKNGILRRDYVPATVVAAVLSKVCAQIGGILDSLPLNVKRKLPALTVTDIEIVKREVVKCQNYAAKCDEVLAREIEEACKNAGMMPE